MQFLDEQEFAQALADEWGKRYRDFPLDLDGWNVAIPVLHAIYRDYRGRALARQKNDAVESEREQRFADYRERVEEITESAAILRGAAERLRWVSGLYVPHEIPDISGTAGSQPIPVIDTTSIPHTTRPVMWLSPFGPDPSTLSDATRPSWMNEFDRTTTFLTDHAAILENVAKEITQKTIGQQGSADRRSFRQDFARLVSRANPGKRLKLYALGALIFSLVYGTDTTESVYMSSSKRDARRRRRR